jgi:hypothetical protein
MSTSDSQLFLVKHYKSMNLETKNEDWELKKKYKNYHGLTCRDFTHKRLGLKAIVIINQEKYSIIEGQDYDFFVKTRTKKIMFYYVPVINNDGLVYYFVKKSSFDKIAQGPNAETEDDEVSLLKRLNVLFDKTEMKKFERKMLIGFPNVEVEVAISKLEKSYFSFQPKLFELLDAEKFTPFYPDLTFTIYSFPDDETLDMENTIEVLFKIASQRKNLTIQDYSRIKGLLKKVSLEEIASVGNIMNGFRTGEDEKLQELLTI